MIRSSNLSSSTIVSLRLPRMMIHSVNFQLEIWILLRNRQGSWWWIILIKLIEVGKLIHCGWHHSLSWDPNMQKAESELSTNIHPLCFLIVDVMEGASIPDSLDFPTVMNYISELWTEIKKKQLFFFYFSCFCQGVVAQEERETEMSRI